MEIRKMTVEEYVSAEKIYSPSEYLDQNPMPFNEERARRQFKFLKDTFGIFVNDKTVGYLQIKTTGEIGILILNRSFKNKGYGTAALKKAIEILRKNNIKTAFCETDVRNTPMRKILEKLGFSSTLTFEKIIPPSVNPKIFVRYEKEI